MAGEVTGPNLGQVYGWDFGDSTWKAGMDANHQQADGVIQLAVNQLAQNTPPSSVDGDRFTVGAAPAGDFSTAAQHDVAVRAEGAWRFYTPRAGWRLWDVNTSTFHVFNGTSWAQEAADAHQAITTGNPHQVTEADAAAQGGLARESFSGAGPHTPAAATDVVMVATGAGGVTLNIPAATSRDGRRYYVKKTSTDTDVVTITPAAGNVEGGATLPIGSAGREGVVLVSDGTDWWLVASA